MWFGQKININGVELLTKEVRDRAAKKMRKNKIPCPRLTADTVIDCLINMAKCRKENLEKAKE